MVIRLGLLITLMCLSFNLFAKGLTAEVDRTAIGFSEQIELAIVLEGSQNGRPDFSALDKDFTTLQRSQSSSVQVVNGLVSYKVRWSLLLSPNRKGMLSIPMFKIGGYQSIPIAIAVGDDPVAQSASNDVLLEVEVKPISPYVKSQAIFTQRLYFAKQLVNDATLETPKLLEGDAELTFLASSNPKRVQRNGRYYQMIERYYAVVANRAGELVFAPSVFRGSVADDSRRRHGSGSLFFNTGKRVTAYSSKASLTIAAQPSEFTGEHWLPSSQLSLDLTWSHSPEALKAGEPVTVTIMLMAEGLKAETLPELKLEWPKSVKAYPEKPQFRTDRTGNGLVGLRQDKVVLVANQDGEFDIPGLEIQWWNTVTNQQEVERIDGFKVSVSGGQLASAAVDTKTPEPSVAKALPEQPEEAIEEEAIQHSFATQARSFYLDNKRDMQIVLAGLLATFVIVAFIVYRRKRSDSSELMMQKKVLSAKQSLVRACRANDSVAAIKALPEWANAVGVYPATLAGIEAAGDEGLSRQVAELSQAAYGKSAEAWSGRGLLLAIEQSDMTESKPTKSEGLGALHPILN